MSQNVDCNSVIAIKYCNECEDELQWMPLAFVGNSKGIWHYLSWNDLYSFTVVPSSRT